jgi:hypothetical protein
VIALGLAAAWLLASCTGDAPSNENARRSDAFTGASVTDDYEFPPGAAQALSITGSTSLLEAGQEMTAVNCAVAIHVTSNLLRGMAQGTGQAEQTALQQAEVIFRQRASATHSAAAIEEQIERAQEAPHSQAQLAVVCLKQISSPG